MNFTISITAAQDGWSVQGDTIENGMMFLSGAEAEAAARSLAQRYSDAGRPTEIEIFLRDGRLAGRYVSSAGSGCAGAILEGPRPWPPSAQGSLRRARSLVGASTVGDETIVAPDSYLNVSRRTSTGGLRGQLDGTRHFTHGSVGMTQLQNVLVLLVEDEPFVRLIASEGLEEAGYGVLEAANAEDALHVLASRRDVGVLFTDVNMPGKLDGLALAEMVHRQWPAIKLVVTSGRPLPGVVPDDGRFLAKPYRLQDMTDTIADVSQSTVE